MTLRSYLLSLRWCTFAKYPPQGIDIYIHGQSVPQNGARQLHRFIKLECFNAVSIDFPKIANKFNPNLRWQFSWLPAEKIDKEYQEYAK